MDFVKKLWEKEITKKIFTFALILVLLYFLRKVMDVLLLTFLFTYLIYRAEKFINDLLSLFVKVNKLLITITLYCMIFVLLGYFIYRFVPIIISQSIVIIKDLSSFKSKIGINKIEEVLTPLIGRIDIEAYIRSETKSIFYILIDIGKWGMNILLALILSLFFMLEKTKIWSFLSKFENSRISSVSRNAKLIGINFLNSFGKVVQVQVVIAATNTVLSLIALSVLQFPQLIALSTMIFMFSLIPVAGTIVSIVPLAIIAYSIGGISKVVYVLLVIGLLYLIESYVLNPQIMSVKTHIPVFIVFIILIISERFMGLWGILIGIPLFMFILDLLEVDLNKSK